MAVSPRQALIDVSASATEGSVGRHPPDLSDVWRYVRPRTRSDSFSEKSRRMSGAASNASGSEPGRNTPSAECGADRDPEFCLFGMSDDEDSDDVGDDDDLGLGFMEEQGAFVVDDLVGGFFEPYPTLASSRDRSDLARSRPPAPGAVPPVSSSPLMRQLDPFNPPDRNDGMSRMESGQTFDLSPSGSESSRREADKNRERKEQDAKMQMESLLAKGGELVRIFAKPPALEMADAPMSPEEMSRELARFQQLADVRNMQSLLA